MEKFYYTTKFNLIEDIQDMHAFYAAQEYLTEDDMLQYFDSSFKEDILSIVWDLKTVNSGIIELVTKRKLTEAELNEVSSWVSGQNSDGLGEGFEQQWFAEIYEDVEHENEYYDEELDKYITETTTEREYIGCASFDWRTNEYKFELDRVEE